MTPEEFRDAGHRLIDWIADYRAGLADRPVMARTEPGEIRAALPETPPEHPEGFDAIVRDLDAILVPGLTHWQHPRFFGYFPSNVAPVERPGRRPQHGPRRARALLAGMPGADGTRGGGRRLDASDGRRCPATSAA